ncbi:MAG: phage holin family protein [Clostridiales bacterium]|nr:phage holin family protein [Clostridiales bacterium]
MNLASVIQTAAAATGAVLGAFVGGFDGFLYLLLIFIATDYMTGLLKGVRQKNLSSEIAFWGLTKKILIFIIIGIANALDVYVLGQGSVVRVAAVFFYVSAEGLSVLENISDLGVPFPQKIKSVLSQLKENTDKEGAK